MGAAKSKEAKKAIQQDGEDNVRQAAVLEEVRKTLPKRAEKLKNEFEDKLEKRLDDKEDFIKRKRDEIDDLMDQRKEEMKKHDKNSIEKLEER